METRAYLIGVAGPSCAGKTELSTHLAARLSAAILPLDGYYFDLSDRPLDERIKFNFDEPGALDHDLFFEHVRDLSHGHGIERPVYDFSDHTRTREVEFVPPGKYIIIEGLFVLYWQDIRSLFGTKVFVDLPDAPCLERRIVRDVRERGRTPASVNQQFRETVQPMAELHVRPTKVFADLVIPGDNPILESVNTVLAHIGKKLKVADS